MIVFFSRKCPLSCLTVASWTTRELWARMRFNWSMMKKSIVITKTGKFNSVSKLTIINYLLLTIYSMSD